MLTKNSAIYFVGRAVPAAFAFLVLIVYTHLLTPAEYGFIALVVAAVDLAWISAFCPLCLCILRFCHDVRTEREYLVPIIQLHMLIGTGIILALLASLAFIGDLVWREAVIFGGALLCAQAWLELQLHLRMSRGDARGYVLQNVTRSSASSLLGCTLAWLGFGATGVLVGLVIGLVAPALLLGRPRTGIGALLTWKAVAIRELWAYALPLIGSGVISMLAARCDRMFILAFHGPTAVGLYALSQDVANRILQAVAVPVGSAALPLAVRALETGGEAAAREQLRRNFALLTAVSIPTAVGLALVSPLLIRVAFGADFQDSTQAALPILAFGAMLMVLRASYVDHAFQISKRTSLFLVVSATTLLVAVTTNLVFTPSFAIIGPAVAFLFMSAAGVTVGFALGRRCIRLPLPLDPLIRVVLATLAMAAAMLLIPRPARPDLALAVMVGAGGTSLALAAFALNVAGIRGFLRSRLSQ